MGRVSCDETQYEMIKKHLQLDTSENIKKINLGRVIMDIVNEDKMTTSLLSKDDQEAINMFLKYGQSNVKRDIIWQGWQEDLRTYLNEKCDREIVWIVGKKY